MRIKESLISYFWGSLHFGLDSFKVFYYQTKSYIKRFVLRSNSLGKTKSIKVKGQSIYFYDDAFSPRELFTIYRNDYTNLEPTIFNNLKTFVDIGANIGLVSKCVSLKSPECKIWCFEPIYRNAKLCILNNPDARVEYSAIGSKTGECELLVDKSSWMASNIKFGYDQTKKIFPMMTLDYALKDFDGKIDLIKIDTEGLECEVIKGAKNTLKRTTSVIAEIHNIKLERKFLRLMVESGFWIRGRGTVEKDVKVVVFVKNNGEV